MLNLSQIENQQKENGPKFVFFSEDLSFTWSDYRNLVANNILRMLKNNTIGTQTKRIIIMSENNWKTFILYSILSSLGVPFSGIDYTRPEEIQLENIKNSESNFLFFSDSHFPSLEFQKKLRKEGIGFQAISETIQFDTESYNDQKVFYSIEAFKKGRQKDISSFSFTSGTSGIPKVIFRNSGFDNIRIPILTKLYNFNKSDIFLASLPFYHVSVTGWIRLTLLNGGAIVIADIENMEDLYTKLVSYNVTTTLFTPPILKKMVEKVKKRPQNLNLRFIMVGGKSFPISLKDEAITVFGPIISEYYGSSETGINTLISSKEYMKHPSSSGKAMEGSEIVIVDENYNRVSDGMIGRIAIHSFQNASGYLHRHMERIIIDEKEFILTSDYGKMIDEYIYVTQRKILNNCICDVDVFHIENTIRLFQKVIDIAILTERNKVACFVTFENNISELKKKLLLNSILEYVKNSLSHSLTVTVIEKKEIDYSLSGKIKYFSLEKK